MKPSFHNYKIPSGFTIKPSVFKPKRSSNSNSKVIQRVLYALAIKDENGWKAHINTKGIEGYQDVTVLDFTESTFELKGKEVVFYNEKDKKGYNIRVERSYINASVYPGSMEMYCALCHGDVFSGHIVRVNGLLQFDVIAYKGMKNYCEHLLNKNYSKKVEEDEC